MTSSSPRLERDAAPEHAGGPPLRFYLGPILERNIFDSSPPVVSPAPATEAARVTASELPAQLLSTSVATDPAWSTAMVRPDPKARPQILRVGGRLQDGVVREILRPRFGPEGKLLPARIVLERGGRLEYIDEDNKPPRTIKKKKKRRKKRRRGRRRNRKR